MEKWRSGEVEEGRRGGGVVWGGVPRRWNRGGYTGGGTHGAGVLSDGGGIWLTNWLAGV